MARKLPRIALIGMLGIDPAMSGYVAAQDQLNGRKMGPVFRKKDRSGLLVCYKVVRRIGGSPIEQQTCEEACLRELDKRQFVFANCTII
ncbi:hypothetical protein [Bosea sp. Root670]|uniref:hypothetical protein n=1 Tax=Bosea sp. Root670 TaxID=1736583 RepID=UPI0012E38BC0|nr:hypothetical protein [Bosea sp. Root670]